MSQEYPVTTREIDYAAEVKKQWGKDWNKPEVVYEFSGGRQFQSTDHTDSGIYEQA